MKCLLDTCVMLWLADRTENLSSLARQTLEDSANTLVFSQVSKLEIQLKYDRGKLPLAVRPEAFVREATRQFGLDYLQLADEHIWATSKLPQLHRDPFDRLLIAQAAHEGLMIVTPDPHIQAYPVRSWW